MSLKDCVVILWLLATLPASADIYRCQMGDGRWLFTDRHCIKGAGQEVMSLPRVTNRKSEPAGLSEAEHKVLKELEQRMAESREFRMQQRKRNSIQIRKNHKIKQQNCTLAVRQLARLQDRKSHGYKLSEAQSLDQQIRELKAIKRNDCG
jgi:hypothetical protein